MAQAMSYRQQNMCDYLKEWAQREKAGSRTVTGKGLASLVERIAHGGRVTDQDEHVVRQTLYGQQGMWAVIITIDTLILTMLLPLILSDQLTPRDGEDRFSQATLERLFWSYNCVACLTFFFTCFHIVMCTFFYACSSYLFDTESVLWLYVHFSSSISFLNLSAFPISFGTIVTVGLGQAIIWGPTKSLPAIVMASTTICAIIAFYALIMKPRFFQLFSSSDSLQWDRKTL